MAVFTLFLLLPFFTNNATAATTTKQRVYDEANLLNQKERTQLEEMAEKYSVKRETDFIILTTKNQEKKDVEKYMQDFYDEQGLGYDQKHGNTAILTVDMSHREIYLAGFYKAKTYLDRHRLDLIRDKITSDLSAKNYFDAFQTFITTADRYMGIKPGVDPENILFKLWFQLAVSIGMGGGVVWLMTYNSGGKVTIHEKTYEDPKTSKVLERRDQYIRTSTTKWKKPKNNSKGGSGGITGGGHSHSGSRGSF
ncbi:TPM domain-containing protein [Oikeobacillus pervagus]